jgi:hypothetical protein
MFTCFDPSSLGIRAVKHDDDFHDHDFDTERFVAFAICDHAGCGDVLAMAGYLDFVEVDSPHGFHNIRVLPPEIMHFPVTKNATSFSCVMQLPARM